MNAAPETQPACSFLKWDAGRQSTEKLFMRD